MFTRFAHSGQARAKISIIHVIYASKILTQVLAERQPPDLLINRILLKIKRVKTAHNN